MLLKLENTIEFKDWERYRLYYGISLGRLGRARDFTTVDVVWGNLR